MIFLEMDLERIVVNVILLLSTPIATVADVTALVFISAVRVQLVVAVEALSTETTFWMAFEAALVDGTGVIVTELLVIAKFGVGEELVLVGEDFLVACAKVASNSSACATAMQGPLSGTHHMTLLCAVFTWRCKSGHPRQATSQSASGQLYCSNSRPSSKTLGFSKWMPKLSSDLKKSAAVKSSYLFSATSVRMTCSDSVLQCAHAFVLYSARIRMEQMWQVRWLQGATAVCWTGEAQMKQTSASGSSSALGGRLTLGIVRTGWLASSASLAGALPFCAAWPRWLFAPSRGPRPYPRPRLPCMPPRPRPW
jgi:hypothetical protein